MVSVSLVAWGYFARRGGEGGWGGDWVDGIGWYGTLTGIFGYMDGGKEKVRKGLV